MKLIHAIVSVAFFWFGCAEVDDASTADTAAIIGGKSTSAYPAVMALFAGDLSSGSGALCTASLIAPRVLLTAAHCVAASEVGADAQFTVFDGTDFNTQNGPMLAVSQVMHDSAFNVNALQSGHDIGAVILSEPLSVKPVPVNRIGDPTQLIGAAVQLVGYGVNKGAAQTGAGIKRQTLTTLDAATDRLLQVGDKDHGTCQGDSGGPAFMTINRQPTLVGLTSFGAAGCGDGGYDTRVDRYGSFIDSALARGN